MDSHDIKNGTKILINNRVYTVVAVVMHTVYVKHAPSCTDYDYTEDDIIKKYKIEFLNKRRNTIMAKEYLEFTQEEIENALAKMSVDQRAVVTDLADRDMLEYIPNIGEKAIPDYINELMVDAIVEALTPYIRDAVYGCTLGLNHYFDPFKTYRKLILAEREKAGKHDEESR